MRLFDEIEFQGKRLKMVLRILLTDMMNYYMEIDNLFIGLRLIIFRFLIINGSNYIENSK